MKRKEIREGSKYVAILRQGSRSKTEIYDPEADTWSTYVSDWRRDQFVVKVLDTDAKHQPVRWSDVGGRYINSGRPVTGVKVLIQKTPDKGKQYWFGAWRQKVEVGDEVVIPAQLIVNTVANNARLNDLARIAEERRQERKDEEERDTRNLAAKLEKAGVRTNVFYSRGGWRCQITSDPADILELING